MCWFLGTCFWFYIAGSRLIQNIALDYGQKKNLLDIEENNIEIIKRLSKQDLIQNIKLICEYFYEKQHRKNNMNQIDTLIFDSLDEGVKKIILNKNKR